MENMNHLFHGVIVIALQEMITIPYKSYTKVSNNIQNQRSGGHIVPLDMKGCICHLLKQHIHPFTSKISLSTFDDIDNFSSQRTEDNI